MSYYHPRTGEGATLSKEYLHDLSDTTLEVRKKLKEIKDAPILPADVKNLYDLLFKVILDDKISVNRILECRSDKTARDLSPQLFEGMWIIAFALGLIPGFPIDRIQVYTGKITEVIAPVNRVRTLEYLKSRTIATSSREGASDLTLSMTDTGSGSGQPTFYFCSSKFYEREIKKSVDDYDISEILTAAMEQFKEKQFKILLLVRDKGVVTGKLDRAYRRYLARHVNKDTDIFGREDLEAAFIRLREQVGMVKEKEAFVQTSYFGEKPPRPFLSLRFHQELIVEKSVEIYLKDKEKRDTLLWGVVPRGGKTYMCGGFIRQVDVKVIFIVAGAYSETKTQFIEDMFLTEPGGFQDFADYTVVDVKSQDFVYDESKKYIFFISIELLRNYAVETSNARERNIINLLKDETIVPDVVFFDEIHKGGTTQLADDAMQLISKHAFKIFMTATYTKPFIKEEYKITESQLITWDYEDIQRAKTMESAETILYFEQRYGDALCRDVISKQLSRGNTSKVIAEQYQKFPDIMFLTTSFSETYKKSIQSQVEKDETVGFSMSALFHTRSQKPTADTNILTMYKQFINVSKIGLFLNYLGPANTQLETVGDKKITTIPGRNEHIVDRISMTSERLGDKLAGLHGDEFKPHSQLWFLPQPTIGAVGAGDDGPLLLIMKCLASAVMIHPWFHKHFAVLIVSSSTRDDKTLTPEGGFIATTNGGVNTKATVSRYEKEACALGRGLIILAGKMLTLGVSLPCVNVVCLFDDSKSSDATYQKMFRALTESDGKKVGYVVDMNPVRTLKVLYDYTVMSIHNKKVVRDTENPVTILTNLYLVDEDQLFTIGTDGKRLNTTDTLHAHIEQQLRESRKMYKTIFQDVETQIKTVDLKEEFASLMDSLKRTKTSKIGIPDELADEPGGTGIERLKESATEKKSKKEASSSTSEEDKMRSLQQIPQTAVTLLAFLSTSLTISEAILYYESNTDDIQNVVYNTIMDRGLVDEKTSKETVKNVTLSSLRKVETKLLIPYSQMRERVTEASDDQKEVLEFILENLTPKKEQVAARGEVFTPLKLVEDMLDKLPADVWMHPEYRWLDPSNGIGNFPVVAFTKLFNGLSAVIPDENARKKHIVENMLFMVEIDKTNIQLSKKLLHKMCGNSECKINLLEHDFLTLTPDAMKTAFGFSDFHVAMGNPPYNPPKTETGSSGNSIWQNFVLKLNSLLVSGGYLCLVHPPGWKKPTEELFDPRKFVNGVYTKQVRVGQVWQVLKAQGAFTYIYTNDNKSKTLEYFKHFPSVDYYVYQKGADVSVGCSTKNIFLGNSFESENVVLDYTASYIPNLITKETIEIISLMTKKEGEKAAFRTGVDPRSFPNKDKGDIKYIYDSSAKGINYSFYKTRNANVDISKVILNENGGIDGYTCKFVDSSESLGVLHHTLMYTTDAASGRRVEVLFNSDIVKFMFLITQYSSGKMTTNERFVANSITIPPVDVTDYYEFFGLTPEHKSFIETTLALYNTFKAPKKKSEAKHTTPKRKPRSLSDTRKKRK
jgi:Type III restriction enzyme, res subunit